jgi:acyl-CoA dehydrogenase
MIRDPDTLASLLDTLSRFVRERLIPQERSVDENDELPPDLVQEFRALGLFGMSIDEEYGGLGLTMEEEVLAALELGRTSAAFRSLIGTNNGIGSQSIIMDGTGAQKRTYLPLLASGEIIGSFALTEPDAGSDAASVSTRATRSGDHYILNGTKRYITNAPRAGLFTVFARTGSREDGAKGISAFLVDVPRKGLTVGRQDKKMGQKGAPVADVTFEDCVVPADALLGGVEGAGFATAMRVLDRGRLHISAVCVGQAERLIADMLAYALQRHQFGKPLADQQLVQAMLAESRAEALAARCMVLETARAKDGGHTVGVDAACCKLFASEMVGRVADRAVQIHGGAGYMAEYGIERFYRDVRLFRIYEGASEIQKLVIARGMIKDAKGRSR